MYRTQYNDFSMRVTFCNELINFLHITQMICFFAPFFDKSVNIICYFDWKVVAIQSEKL